MAQREPIFVIDIDSHDPLAVARAHVNLCLLQVNCAGQRKLTNSALLIKLNTGEP